MQFRILSSADELVSVQDAWDDLWKRSDTPLPTAQAGPLLLWLKHFAAGQQFRAIVVEHEGRMLAALPLVGHRVAPSIQVGRLTHNDWSTGGDLMIDPLADPDAVVRQLGGGFKKLPWPLLWLTGCRPDMTAWRMLLSEWSCSASSVAGHPRFNVGLVDIPADFDKFEKSWSRNHRRHMRKARQRLEADGDWSLDICSDVTPEDVEPLLRSGFEIEHRGWKGAAGSSVLATPGMFDFYLEQARLFAASGNLRLVFLHHHGQPIAFEYGWRSKGFHITPKVAYDERFSQYTPGQLLRYHFLRRMSEECPGEIVDFLGPISDATSKWTTDSYSVDTVLVALRPILGRAMISAYKTLRRARGLPLALSMSTDEGAPVSPAAS